MSKKICIRVINTPFILQINFLLKKASQKPFKKFMTFGIALCLLCCINYFWLLSTASMNDSNNGCGRVGRDLNSG